MSQLRTAIAVLVSDLQTGSGAPPDEIQLLPSGEFRTADGRPESCQAFRLTSAEATRAIARFAARGRQHVIDYEHQTLATERNGQPAPAAGWFTTLKYVEGQGLFAAGVEWTERAQQMIAAKEYRYLSAVFPYDLATGAVLDIYHAGLTNHPAIDGMRELAAARFGGATTIHEETGMNEKLAQLLGLAAGATEQEILDAIDKLLRQAQDAQGQIAAAKARTPDPAAYVPIAIVEELKTQIAALTARQTDGDVTALVETGLKDGRLLPAQEAWARDLGRANLAALKGYLEKTPPIAALAGTQTGGKPPDDKQSAGKLTEQQLAICKALGTDPKSYSTIAAKEQAA
jgi:phage I-like protein